MLQQSIKILLQHALTSLYLLPTLLIVYYLTWDSYISRFLCLMAFVDMLRVLTSNLQSPMAKDCKVVVVGAGMAGICMAKKLLDAGVKPKDLVVLEKNSSLGGTWVENVYPGVACDVPSHLYSFSFFQNPSFTKAFSGGNEIIDYLKKLTAHFGIDKLIKYNRKVKSARWDSDLKKWHVLTDQGENFEADFLVQGTGLLTVPHYPKFKNQDSFKGRVLHSARYDPSLDLRGKRVGVIGTGASAVQIVPEIADQVKDLYVFQRTAAWSPRRFQAEYSPALRSVFGAVPWLLMSLRYAYFTLNEFLFQTCFGEGGRGSAFLSGFVAKSMRKAVNDADDAAELAEKLTPKKFKLGCKRMTPSDTYVPAFVKRNVHLITDGIREFDSDGIVTDENQSVDLDIVILATGFDMQRSVKPFPIRGQNNKDLHEEWGDTPRSYLGVTNPSFPNYFLLYGPGSNLGHSSILFVLECQANYVADCIRATLGKGKRAVDLRPDVFSRYLKWNDGLMPGVVFGSSNCRSWYKNEEGVNWANWPADLVTFWWRTRKCDENDYVFS